MEHLVVVLVPLHHHLPTYSCLGQEAFEWTSIAVPILWFVSNFFLAWHYKNFHTWSQTNGPLQTCLGSKDEEKCDGQSFVMDLKDVLCGDKENDENKYPSNDLRDVTEEERPHVAEVLKERHAVLEVASHGQT